MSSSKQLPGPQKFTLTVIISFIAVFVFCMLMMLWHGSYEKNPDGTMRYNTRVNEPSSSY
jgi:hypothetical protein